MAKYGPKAQEAVEEAMHKMKKGKLKSGKSKRTVTSQEQAVAIGLSEAREKGAKVPAPKKRKAKKATTKKRTTAKKTAKRTTKKTAKRTVKRTAKKAAPKKRKTAAAKTKRTVRRKAAAKK